MTRFPVSRESFSIVYKEQMLTVLASGFHDVLINSPCLASSHNIVAWTRLTTSLSNLHNLTVYFSLRNSSAHFSLHNTPFYNISSSFNIPATSLHNTTAPPHNPPTQDSNLPSFNGPHSPSHS